MIRSVDGAEWDIVRLAGLGFGPDLVAIDEIIAGGPGFIAAGRILDDVSPQDPAATRLGPPTDGAIWTSPDLATWTRVDPGRVLFGDVRYASGLLHGCYILVGLPPRGVITHVVPDDRDRHLVTLLQRTC